jgi:hypothetical protein
VSLPPLRFFEPFFRPPCVPVGILYSSLPTAPHPISAGWRAVFFPFWGSKFKEILI